MYTTRGYTPNSPQQKPTGFNSSFGSGKAGMRRGIPLQKTLKRQLRSARAPSCSAFFPGYAEYLPGVVFSVKPLNRLTISSRHMINTGCRVQRLSIPSSIPRNTSIEIWLRSAMSLIVDEESASTCCIRSAD